jgi:hypothetical protein
MDLGVGNRNDFARPDEDLRALCAGLENVISG